MPEMQWLGWQPQGYSVADAIREAGEKFYAGRMRKKEAAQRESEFGRSLGLEERRTAAQEATTGLAVEAGKREEEGALRERLGRLAVAGDTAGIANLVVQGKITEGEALYYILKASREEDREAEVARAFSAEEQRKLAEDRRKQEGAERDRTSFELGRREVETRLRQLNLVQLLSFSKVSTEYLQGMVDRGEMTHEEYGVLMARKEREEAEEQRKIDRELADIEVARAQATNLLRGAEGKPLEIIDIVNEAIYFKGVSGLKQKYPEAVVRDNIRIALRQYPQLARILSEEFALAFPSATPLSLGGLSDVVIPQGVSGTDVGGFYQGRQTRENEQEERDKLWEGAQMGQGAPGGWAGEAVTNLMRGEPIGGPPEKGVFRKDVEARVDAIVREMIRLRKEAKAAKGAGKPPTKAARPKRVETPKIDLLPYGDVASGLLSDMEEKADQLKALLKE